MNKKENLAAALEGQVPGQVPIWELASEMYEGVSGRKMALGFETEKLTGKELTAALEMNADVMVQVSEELHYAGVSTVDAMWKRGKNDWSYFSLPRELADAQMTVLSQKLPDDVMLVGKTGGIICPPSNEGYVEFAYKLFDAPDEVEQQAKDTLAAGLEQAKRCRDAGCGAVFNPADLADNHGPFFKPEHMERFITPYLRKWAEGVREMGMYSILHTDGNIEPIIDILMDSGLNAIQALDPTAGVDIKRVQDKVKGKLCLCGNVDCGQLLTGTPDEVKTSARALLDSCAPQGGLVFGASNAVVKETPVENYRAMIRAWEEYHA